MKATKTFEWTDADCFDRSVVTNQQPEETKEDFCRRHDAAVARGERVVVLEPGAIGGGKAFAYLEAARMMAERMMHASDMPAERLGSTGFDRRHDFELAQADLTGMVPAPRGTMLTEDICDLQLRPGHPGFGYSRLRLRVRRFSCLRASNGLGVSRIVLVATWV